jgi:signal transduction histidine kinase
MFTWALTGLLEALFFVLTLYFVYVFIRKIDISILNKVIWGILLLPLIIMIPTKLNLSAFNATECYSLMSNYFVYYKYFVEILSSIILIFFSGVKIKQSKGDSRKQIVLLITGVMLFLFSFFFTVFLSSYLADNGVAGYSIEFYGLFGTIIFMAALMFIIVKFKAFDIKLIGAQALVWALIILVGSQFFYQADMPISSLILTAITLLVSAIVGLMIVRSVKKEVALRESLEIANRNQESLIHFISHQLKGFFTKSKMIFSGLMEGDFGTVTGEVKDVAKMGLTSDNNAVAMIQDILCASNLKTGSTQYTFKKMVLNDLVKKICALFVEDAQNKGLEFVTEIPDEPITVGVDENQIVQAFKNLIDNSIHYTQKGKVTVSLKRSANGKTVIFEVADTGVGLSEVDKTRLFTEGGKGEESLKVNTNSTGYGLYIVKKIVETHTGRVWAQSEGRGKGSQFCVELNLVE